VHWSVSTRVGSRHIRAAFNEVACNDEPVLTLQMCWQAGPNLTHSQVHCWLFFKYRSSLQLSRRGPIYQTRTLDNNRNGFLQAGRPYCCFTNNFNALKRTQHIDVNPTTLALSLLGLLNGRAVTPSMTSLGKNLTDLKHWSTVSDQLLSLFNLRWLTNTIHFILHKTYNLIIFLLLY